jgi:hypothetical protein
LFKMRYGWSIMAGQSVIISFIIHQTIEDFQFRSWNFGLRIDD